MFEDDDNPGEDREQEQREQYELDNEARFGDEFEGVHVCKPKSTQLRGETTVNEREFGGGFLTRPFVCNKNGAMSKRKAAARSTERPQAAAAGASRREEYVARINRVIDFIENHIGDDLTLEGLSSVACFSKYHFHRIFASMVGETLGDYILRLRLEKAAARLLANPKATVTEIALDGGVRQPLHVREGLPRLFRHERHGLAGG
ncbi:MAG: helix-turn-helix transcriptional regulator, partial [Deltaproteobacteria bacterium]|nr:helix-turn-helix transcriptional regulator [Deltaproteobacteria bacterium]